MKIQPAEIWAKIKEIKHFKIIIALLIAAIVCLIYGSYAGKTNLFGKTDTVEKETATTGSTINYTEEEIKLANTLSEIEGIGMTKVYITYDNDKKVQGVIILAENGNDPVTEWKIRHAVMTALQTDYHNIDVYTMK